MEASAPDPTHSHMLLSCVAAPIPLPGGGAGRGDRDGPRICGPRGRCGCAGQLVLARSCAGTPMPCHALLCHAMPCHAHSASCCMAAHAPCCAMLPHDSPWHVMGQHPACTAVPCHGMACHAALPLRHVSHATNLACRAHPMPPPLPRGHILAGSGMQRFKPGDRVMSPFTANCGECFYCRRGLTARCLPSRLLLHTLPLRPALPRGRCSCHASRSLIPPCHAQRLLLVRPCMTDALRSLAGASAPSCLAGWKEARACTARRRNSSGAFWGWGFDRLLSAQLACRPGATPAAHDLMWGRQPKARLAAVARALVHSHSL